MRRDTSTNLVRFSAPTRLGSAAIAGNHEGGTLSGTPSVWPSDRPACGVAAFAFGYLSNCRAICGAWFAWANTAIVDCCRICVRTISDTDCATSASRIRLFAAPMFSADTLRLFTALLIRFCAAPRKPRCVLTSSIAASSCEIAAFAD